MLILDGDGETHCTLSLFVGVNRNMENGSNPDITRAENVVEEVQRSAGGLREAVSRGAADATEASTHLLASAGKVAEELVYGACYGVAFGVTFAALAVGRLIPVQSLFGRAVSDGVNAAREAMQRYDELEKHQPPNAQVAGTVNPA